MKPTQSKTKTRTKAGRTASLRCDALVRPPFFFPLFEHMSREHGLTLIDSELSEIVRIAEKLSADAARIDWMQAQEVKRAMDTGTQGADFLVLAEDGTTCWGKTFRESLDAAMAHDLANTKAQPDAQNL
jgi:hypothetical protein